MTLRRSLLRGRVRGLAMTTLGVALVWAALGAFGYVAGWEYHARHASSALDRAERAVVDHERSARRALRHPRPCVVDAPRTGQLAGLLEVPSIHVVAPVEEGTTDAVLAVAVGHDPSSVWPGEDGPAALLAHDVSYFVNLGALKPGAAILYRTACSTTRFVVSRSEVVEQGAPIRATRAPSLVLVTCYPTNALFFTTQRLVVLASEVDRDRAERATQVRAEIRPPATSRVSYRVPAPAALVAQGLTLQRNEVPMGKLSLRGDTSQAWSESPGPMALEAAALEAYFGGLRASSESRMPWWRAISISDVGMPVQLRDAATTEDATPLDVRILSVAHHPVEVVLTTVIDVRGGRAPGTYAERVTAVVRGTEVVLSGWSLLPASV